MTAVRKATRESYGEELAWLGAQHPEIVVLDADLSASTKTAIFKKSFPERHINCGIAEANMAGIAAGLAACGKVPFMSSFAMFASGRCFEQIRNSIAYPGLNVKIGATHAGISVGEDGATHQANEDIAIMRALPGMVIINPCDDIEARAAVDAAYMHKGPVYMRFGRLAVPIVNDPETYKFELGKAIVLREGTDISIIATGLCVTEALKAADILREKGISAEIINVHTIKPIDRETLANTASKTRLVMTVEEHSVIGGLGSAVSEALAETVPTRLLRVGINDIFGESGPALELIKRYGLDGESIASRAEEYYKLNKGIV